jgi:tetratricopeptide (TPR) repeat protein
MTKEKKVLDDLQQWNLSIRAFDEGQALSEAEARDMERRLPWLKSSLKDLLVLHAYFIHKSDQPESALEIVLLLIENHPEFSPLAAQLQWCLHSTADDRAQIKAAWLRQVETNPDEPRVLSNAAGFLKDLDLPAAIVLARRALKLAPQDRWCQCSLASMLLQAVTSGSAEASSQGREALQIYELLLEDDTGEIIRMQILKDVARAALAAGEFERSKSAALEVLSFERGDSNDIGEADASFWAHNVLGKLAYRDGDLNLACEHMLASGRISLSSCLHPEPELVGSLLRRGKIEEVKRHLRDWLENWPEAKCIFDGWMCQIDQGEVPDFSRFGC